MLSCRGATWLSFVYVTIPQSTMYIPSPVALLYFVQVVLWMNEDQLPGEHLQSATFASDLSDGRMGTVRPLFRTSLSHF